MDVPQSAMAFAQGGLKRDDPRFYSLTVLNQVLGGGGLTSRLFDEVREKPRVGLLRLHRAGSARSLGARPRRRGHGQRAGCGHNPGHPRPMAAARGGWRRHRRTRGQQNLSHGSFLCASPAAAGSPLLVSVQLDNLGIDYLDRRNALIEAVTLQDVNTLARELLAPDKLTFIIVGDPRSIGRCADKSFDLIRPKPYIPIVGRKSGPPFSPHLLGEVARICTWAEGPPTVVSSYGRSNDDEV